MSHTRNIFASLSVFAVLLGTSSLASAQVMPPQPAGAPVGGVEFFLPTYVTPAGNCACWDSDGATNGGYNPETASAIFSACYYPQVGYNLYVVHRTVPNGPVCYAEFVCGQPTYTDGLGNTVQARAMVADGPDGGANTEVLYSEINTNCTNCAMSPLKGWIGYQGGPMTNVAPELLNIEYDQSYSQLGGNYDWANGTWSGTTGNPMHDGDGFRLPYCSGTFDTVSLPSFPPLNMVIGGGNVISEYPQEYQLQAINDDNDPGVSEAEVAKIMAATNGGKPVSHTSSQKTTVIKSKHYTTYRTEIIVKPASVKTQAAPVKVAPVIKK